MGGQDEITRVDEIGLNDPKLEEKATELVRSVTVLHSTIFNYFWAGEALIIDAQETIGKPFRSIDRSVRAILVMIHSDAGLVRIYGQSTRFVATGLGQGSGFAIVFIRSEEKSMVHGHPSMRFFRRCR